MLAPVKNYPAIIHKHKQHKTLIISDLHLGWEIDLARKGIHVPSQMPKILQKLLQLIKTTTPHTLIISGDVKHTIAKVEAREWRDVPKFFETIKTKIKDIQIIRGNHDGNLKPLIPPNIPLHRSTGITLNTTGVFHGHTWPARSLLSCHTLIMGHVHPTVVFHDTLGFRITTPVWLKAKCDTAKLVAAYLKGKRIKADNEPMIAIKKRFKITPKVKQLLIIPCFNEFLGGRAVNQKGKRRKYIGPVLRSEAININEADVYFLDGTFLGTVKQLKALS